MKCFASIHDRKSKRYAIYYSVVLVVIMGTVAFETLQIIHQAPIQAAATFWEGFFSLFMLGRHEKVGNSLLSHLAKAKQIPRLSLF